MMIFVILLVILWTVSVVLQIVLLIDQWKRVKEARITEETIERMERRIECHLTAHHQRFTAANIAKIWELLGSLKN